MVSYKSRMEMKGNIRANMYVYTVVEDQDSTVVLQEEGDVGCYNRANRSLHHFAENAWTLVLPLVLAGVVFPVPSFVLLVLFAVGRVWHQLGYSSSGYGAHAMGFTLSLVTSLVLEGLVIVVALRQL